jgi:hypothetical protein
MTLPKKCSEFWKTKSCNSFSEKRDDFKVGLDMENDELVKICPVQFLYLGPTHFRCSRGKATFMLIV